MEPNIIEEVELPLSSGQEAVGARNKGGETVPAWAPHEPIVPTPTERPSTGKTSRFPYEVTRKGVTRK